MTDHEPLPVAVIGAGNMGANHVRVYSELEQAELVEIVEPDPETAARIREEYDVEILDAVEDISRAEAATIAVPNEHHLPVARTCIADRELDVLVEKPLATTIEEADTIVELARKHDAVLQVGHIERYNPAVQLLEDVLEDEEVFALETHRLGPFHDQLSTENVIFDLMIHDVDVITSIVDTSLSELSAFGTAPRSETCDHATAQLQFNDGTLGTSTASHVTHGKVRELTVTTADAYISLDYQNQSLVLQRRGIERTTELPTQSGYRTETVTETPYVQTREPLKVELESFIDCVRNRTTPVVDGEEGRDAVKLATKISDAVTATR